MDIERNTDVLHRELEVITRILGKVAFLLFLICCAIYASPGEAAEVRVMTTGLGTGTITSTDGFINCPTGGTAAQCSRNYPIAGPVVLNVADGPNSRFVRWLGDCASALSAPSCSTNSFSLRSVRAEFRQDPDVASLTVEPTPANLQAFLVGGAGDNIRSPAAFLKALPDEYKQGWILMTRSESLQAGTAKHPRILFPSITGQYVFTIATLETHPSYPGSHEDAIEFMQWDPLQRNFRFHEIVVNPIPALTTATPAGMVTFPARPTRGVFQDEPRCTRCHSTRNVLNPNSAKTGTDGIPPQAGWAKNKPNWDAYDSWGGAMPFNRDRIYQGSVEAAALRRMMNWWTYREDPAARRIVELLQMQPPGSLASGSDSTIVRLDTGGATDGHVRFGFDDGATVTTEPLASGSAGDTPIAYNFDFDVMAANSVERQGRFAVLHAPGPQQGDEGRGVQLFDRLGGFADSPITAATPITNPPNPAAGRFNQHRVGHELGKHVFATGGVPLDARPTALAITKGCLRIDTPSREVVSTVGVALTVNHTFFTERNGDLDVVELRESTVQRAQRLPQRKADIQRYNYERDGDVYLFPDLSPSPPPVSDLFQEYRPFSTPAAGLTDLQQLRQEIFRRDEELFSQDSTMGGILVDREDYSANQQRIAMYRYLLEPLGVSVDKWSMGVRGRSRTYTFADIFFAPPTPGFDSRTYVEPLKFELELSLAAQPYPGLAAPYDCNALVTAVNSSLAGVMGLDRVLPTYTDVQRVFNKGCIECHGGLGYPPFTNFYPVNHLDFSEEDSPAGPSRLSRSYQNLADRGYLSATSATNTLYLRVTTGDEMTCPGRMPCGGPRLSEADIVTLRRWIDGTPMVYSEGDPHLHTVDGTSYDFQSAGEFTLLRGEGLEVQSRITPVEAASPLGPEAHSGLVSCPSLNTAAAVQVGAHRVTLLPGLGGQPSPNGMQLRVDGKLQEKLGERGISLPGGGRIMPTSAPGGILIQAPGGTEVVVTPQWWDHYQLWYLNINVRNARTNYGVMGAIGPGNWLPALADGSYLGSRPASLADRHKQLYEKFADSWRVTNASSLFDYAAGTSTSTFTLKGWPQYAPASCKLPSGWAPKVPPQKPYSADAAKEVCTAVVDAERRNNCERDLMTTGEPSFVQAYLATEKIVRNSKPRAPALVSPAVDERGLPGSLLFEWKASNDKDGGSLRYLHCLWPAGEKTTFKDCRDIPAGSLTTVAQGLKSGTDYRWKVLVEDGQGATVESETRRFAVK